MVTTESRDFDQFETFGDHCYYNQVHRTSQSAMELISTFAYTINFDRFKSSHACSLTSRCLFSQLVRWMCWAILTHMLHRTLLLCTTFKSQWMPESRSKTRRVMFSNRQFIPSSKRVVNADQRLHASNAYFVYFFLSIAIPLLFYSVLALFERITSSLKTLQR